MKELFTYDIWLYLLDTLGFENAVAFLLIGLGISLMGALYFTIKCLIGYYEDLNNLEY